MSFAKPRPHAPPTRPRFDPRRSRFALPPFVASPMVRVVVLALAGVLGASWALVRHAHRRMPPLLRSPDPAPASTYDADAGEMPVPDFATWDGG